MKKILLSAALAAMALGVSAQTEPAAKADSIEGFRFTTIDSVGITPVKNQHRSSTCWAFSAIGFLESELLRMGKGEYDLSEMLSLIHI